MSQSRKKLIEVALPLGAINEASVREGYIYRGNPSALHKWWAQRPLAAARAVIFAQMVDDPSGYADVLLSDPKLKAAANRALRMRLSERAAHEKISGEKPAEPEPTLEEVATDLERQRLFAIIEQLVKWESTTNEAVLSRARDEIWQSWRRACAENADHPRAKELFDRGRLPAFHDPFAGGGALPLEAQRLGLEAHGSDLNPVAVLINKAMIEIPPRFAGRPPVNPEAHRKRSLLAEEWKGARGLAEDVRYYGKWMRDEAERRIGHLYPKIEITKEMAKDRPDLEKYVGQQLMVIAWLWARTVRSPNPAFTVEVPLASTFMLSTRKGKETYVEPVVDGSSYHFTVKVGKPNDPKTAKAGTKLGRGANFRCLMSGTPMDPAYVYAEAKAGRMGARLMAIVAEGDRGRIYVAPTLEHENTARQARPAWRPDVAMPDNPRWFSPPLYGLTTFGDLFTPRQLVALTALSDLVQEVRRRASEDAQAFGPPAGTAMPDYPAAIATLLSFSVDKTAEYNCTIVPWYAKEDRPKGLFARQAIPMVWDYAEVNPLADIGGTFAASVGIVSDALLGCAAAGPAGAASQQDAVAGSLWKRAAVISTDPPYYDNVGYADLSDFFYVWLRRSLRPMFPELFATVVVPKADELVATPYRHGGKDQAEAFFMAGMTRAMQRLAEQTHPAFPVTIYYAFKQSETADEEGTASTGWEKFLDAVIQAGFSISGTWPMRTERGARATGIGTNALASSIVLVCRPRAPAAPTTSRREFLTILKAELPAALSHLQRSNIAPVDLAQAAIGPGMAAYTRYARVLESDGSPLGVRTALALINQVLDETLAEQEGDFDVDTRWALAWFEQSGFDDGEYGVAETLSKAKNTSVSGLVEAGVLTSKGGKVRLLAPAELSEGWEPESDPRLTVWEMVHHLIRTLEAGGEAAAGELTAKLGAKADAARELAYRLYSVCERKKRANLALSYNALVQSWPEIARLAQAAGKPTAREQQLPGME